MPRLNGSFSRVSFGILAFCLTATLASAADKAIKEPLDVLRSYAARGEPSSQFNLALRLQNGEDGKPDLPAALAWYRKSADAGFPAAQYNLALLLTKGEGVAKDEKLAAKFFYAAATQGLFEAQKALIHCYAHGLGVQTSPEKALQWDFLARRTLELRFDEPAGEPHLPSILRPDGYAEYTSASGQKEAISPNGVLEHIGAGGVRRMDNPDGSTMEIFPDGTKTAKFPDGGSVTQYADGRSVAKDKNGTVETKLPDGSRTLESDGTTDKGEKTRVLIKYDPQGKQISQRFKAMGRWIESLPDGAQLAETEGEDDQHRKVCIIDRIEKDGSPGPRRIIRDDGVEHEGKEIWTVTYWRIRPGFFRQHVREKFGLGNSSFGEVILEDYQIPFGAPERPIQTMQFSTSQEVRKDEPVVMQSIPGSVLVTPDGRRIYQTAPSTRRVGAGDSAPEERKIAAQLKELAQLELDARYFPGLSPAQYQQAKSATQAYLFTLPFTPQKPLPVGWLNQRLADMAGPPPPPPLTQIPRDCSDRHPLGLYGTAIIKRYPWKHAETQNFVIHYIETSNAYPVVQNIEGAFYVVARILQLDTKKYQHKSHVFVFPDAAAWNSFTREHEISSRVAGFAYKDELLFGAVAKGDEYIKLLSHETTHAVVSRFYPGRQWPLWLNEGFAEYMAAKALALRTGWPVERFLSNVSLGEIEVGPVFKRTEYEQEIPGQVIAIGPPTFGDDELTRFYARSEKCARTLLEKLPSGSFPEFANLMMAENPPAAALKKAYGAACPDLTALSGLLNSTP